MWLKVTQWQQIFKKKKKVYLRSGKLNNELNKAVDSGDNSL